MNVCLECGNPIQDNETVCVTCRNRKITLNKMKEFQSKTVQVEQYLRDIQSYGNELVRVQNEKCYTEVIWIIYGITSFVLMCLSSYGEMKVRTKVVGIFIVWLIGAGIGAATVSENMSKKFNQEKQVKINNLQNTLNQLQNAIPTLWENSNKFIPLQYCNPQTVATLISLIENHRADTLKEAINLYESLRAQGKLMEMQNQMLKSQQSMAISSAISAVANTSTAYHTSRYYKR